MLANPLSSPSAITQQKYIRSFIVNNIMITQILFCYISISHVALQSPAGKNMIRHTITQIPGL